MKTLQHRDNGGNSVEVAPPVWRVGGQRELLPVVERKIVGNQRKNEAAQAFNLGTYIAELDFRESYGRPAKAISCRESLQKLADNIQLSSCYNDAHFKELMDGSINLDSLIIVKQRQFKEMSSYLRSFDQEGLAVAILAGEWLETVYITCLMEKIARTPGLREKITYQKVELNRLNLLLAAYYPNQELAQVFDELTAIYEPVALETGITNEQLRQLLGALERVREKGRWLCG